MIRIPHEFSVAAVVFVLGLCLTGCALDSTPADITIINGNEPESLDPAIVTGVSEMRITKALFEGLLRLDGPEARPGPGLAESWNVSPDGKIYTFHLRTNLMWSTGEKITSRDVLYSWLRALDPATASDYAGQLFYIKNAESYYLGKIKARELVGIRALDEFTVGVELNTPIAFFLDLCCYPTLAVVPRKTIERYGDRWLSATPLPTSGPYELGSWRLNDKVRLERNERYWDAARTRNAIVDILPVASPNLALNLYDTHVADVIWDKDLVPVELLDVLIQRKDFHAYDYLGTYFYRFNVTRRPLDNAAVRKAFALATDREQLVKKLLSGGEKAAFHLVPNGVANYNAPPGIPYDPVEARKLLSQAGYPEGKGFPRLQFSYYAGSGGAGKMQAKLAVELQQMWQQNLGIIVELRQIERKIFYATQSRLDFDISASSWVGDYNDANTFLDLFTSNSGNNRTGWKSAEYDALLRQANEESSREKRAKLLQTAENLLIAEETPIVPVYFYKGFNFFDPGRIDGLYQNLLDEHPIQMLRKVR